MSPDEYDKIPWALQNTRPASELLRRVIHTLPQSEANEKRMRGCIGVAFDIANLPHEPAEGPFLKQTTQWMVEALKRIQDLAEELHKRDASIAKLEATVAARDANIAKLEAAVAAGIVREAAARSDVEEAARSVVEEAARTAAARADAAAAKLECDAAISQARAWEASASAANHAMEIMRAALRIPVDGHINPLVQR